jgi:hypothetical protein
MKNKFSPWPPPERPEGNEYHYFQIQLQNNDDLKNPNYVLYSLETAEGPLCAVYFPTEPGMYLLALQIRCILRRECQKCNTLPPPSASSQYFPRKILRIQNLTSVCCTPRRECKLRLAIYSTAPHLRRPKTIIKMMHHRNVNDTPQYGVSHNIEWKWRPAIRCAT